MLTFYHAPQSRSTPVLWMLEELGEPYDLRVLSLKMREQKKADYLAVNPMGKVPAIAHDDVVVTEAAAICCYLADVYPRSGLAPAVGDPLRGPYLKWLFFGSGCVEPALADRLLRRSIPESGVLGYGDFETLMSVVRAGTAHGPWLLGERFTAADIVIGSNLAWGTMMRIIPEYPEIKAYIGRISSRDAWRRVAKKDAELSAEIGANATPESGG